MEIQWSMFHHLNIDRDVLQCIFSRNFSLSTNSNNNSSTLDANSSDQADGRPVPLKASYDAGWQKRGTGHSYNSLTGRILYYVVIYVRNA